MQLVYTLLPRCTTATLHHRQGLFTNRIHPLITCVSHSANQERKLPSLSLSDARVLLYTVYTHKHATHRLKREERNPREMRLAPLILSVWRTTRLSTYTRRALLCGLSILPRLNDCRLFLVLLLCRLSIYTGYTAPSLSVQRRAWK